MAGCTASLALCIFRMNFDRSPIRISSEEHWKEMYRTMDGLQRVGENMRVKGIYPSYPKLANLISI